MKTNSFLSTLVALASVQLIHSAPVELAPTIVEIGPHHRVWERSIDQVLPDGSVLQDKTGFTELCTGLYYTDETGQLRESQPVFELLPGAAVARKTQIQAILAANFNSAGAIDLLLPNGVRLTGHCLGLSYYDRALNKNVLIAEVRDSIGEQVAENSIIYRSAFTDIRADALAQISRSGFSHTVILRENLPPPEAWGLNSANTTLELYTEWIAPPAPARINQLLISTAPGWQVALADQYLDFGSAAIGNGIAFSVDGSAPESAPVYKSWGNIQGRDLLVESVDYLSIKPHLDRLPPPQAALLKKADDARLARNGQNGRTLPVRRVAKLKKIDDVIKSARLDLRNQKGLAIDFEVVNTSLSNYTFRCDTTYYVSGQVLLSGKNNVLEGGTVLKYAPTNSAQLRFTGTNSAIVCKGDLYRPSLLTSRDDQSAGEAITTNANSGYNASGALSFDSLASTGIRLSNLRIAYATGALSLDHPTNVLVTHVQLIKCNIAVSVYAGDSTFRNLLVYNCQTFINGSSTPKIRCEHLTVRENNNLNAGGIATLYLTNCLLVAVTNAGTYSGAGNATASDPSTVFQTVGGAAHYLITGSAYRDAGTTTIDPTLASDLKLRTTYPPLVLAPNGWYTTNLTMFPQVQRDTDTPDIGYHYDPLDYAVQAIALSNATINILPGTAVGVFSTNNANYGVALFYAAQFYCEGSPTNLNRIVRFNTVQEQANSSWDSGRPYSIVSTWNTDAVAPLARFRFTDFSCLAKDIEHFDGQSTTAVQNYPFNDCQFHGGNLNVLIEPSLSVTNCLFERVTATIDDGGSVPMTNVFRNCLFYGGSWELFNSFTSGWTFKDNFFHNLTFLETNGTFNADYNGYTTNSARFVSGTHDVVLTTTNFAFDTSWLGRFYQPTNSLLINKGSTNANLIGFYHYTCTTNQVKETNSIIDIGFHYVAVDSNGIPIDTDGDGIPDYQEDANGNGLVDSGETDWQNGSDFGLRVRITYPRP